MQDLASLMLCLVFRHLTHSVLVLDPARKREATVRREAWCRCPIVRGSVEVVPWKRLD